MDCRWRSVRGCVLLRAYLASDNAPTQKSLAERLGTTEGVIYAWKVGFRRPGIDYRDALHRIAGIDPDEWLTTAERRRSRAIRAA